MHDSSLDGGSIRVSWLDNDSNIVSAHASKPITTSFCNCAAVIACAMQGSRTSAAAIPGAMQVSLASNCVRAGVIALPGDKTRWQYAEHSLPCKIIDNTQHSNTSSECFWHSVPWSTNVSDVPTKYSSALKELRCPNQMCNLTKQLYQHSFVKLRFG